MDVCTGGDSKDGSEAIETQREINIMEFAESRAKELEAMGKAAKSIVGNTLPLQKLPRHMRRRAASHNVKRLPCRMRNWAMKEMLKSGEPSQGKRPSRKHRRRPSNLLEDYTRRQRTHVWLESHIWHAKRFHMTEKWGYKVALHPNDKSTRAAHRAIMKHCLMMDVSYYCCVEICGPQTDIVQGLSRLTMPETGLGFGAKMYLDGSREGKTILFAHEKCPQVAICEVSFLWKAEPFCGQHLAGSGDVTSAAETMEVRQLWVWTHPAAYQDVWRELLAAFNGITVEDAVAKAEQRAKVDETESKTEGSLKIWLGKAKSKKLKTHGRRKSQPCPPVQREITPPAFKSPCGRVIVTSLKDSLCRFHVSGSESTAVLHDVLQVADVAPSQEGSDAKTASPAGGEDGLTGTSVHQERPPAETPTRWWQALFMNENKSLHHHNQQRELWKNIRGSRPGELPSGQIVGLTVRDPRLFLPRKKTMIYREQSDVDCPVTPATRWTPAVSWSPIWDKEIRSKVKVNRLSQGDLNKLRSDRLVPGTQIDLFDVESRIPVLLIQSPGRQFNFDESRSCGGKRVAVCRRIGSGWDLLLPAGWAMAFWVALVYRGARVGGLRELHSCSLEQGHFSYPNNQPATPAGQEWEHSSWKTLQEKFNRIPPAKRPNYSKFGVVAPFHFPWRELVSEWQKQVPQILCSFPGMPLTATGDPGDVVCTVASQSHLRLLQSLCRDREQTSGKSHSTGSPPPTKMRRLAACETSASDAAHLPTTALSTSSLEYKETSMKELLTTGPRTLVPVQISMLQRGTPSQFAMICIPTFGDLMMLHKDQSYGGPVESSHPDPSKLSRREAKLTTKKAKVSTRAQTTKEKQGTGTGPSHGGVGEPPSVENLIGHCSRQICGFVKEGGFSLVRARGCGLGYVATPGLIQLLLGQKGSQTKSASTLVLVRNTVSYQYRFAHLSVACQ